ncbi:hypothetical protein Hs30E_19510 [Lactococcus hodotermopsidis]|uniref:Uncharacterized protein n=1 Tax=Pseudolactococcus hodotermopsidis TaxID=2709157 RepID=A0A6A0BD82_9LACT|nr:hypothetical protein [Lactococcus hodotermopsidis]GFH43400.1 hypothetical protein Hs30E_19510 [Lactococcus hodotermopsidis]
MNKIKLTESKEKLIHIGILDEETKKLLSEITKLCRQSKLSYIQKNEALHQADAVLYYECISKDSQGHC